MNFIWLLVLANILFGIVLTYKSKRVNLHEFLFVSAAVWICLLLVYGVYCFVRTHDTKFLNDQIISFRYEGPWVSEYTCCKMHRTRCSGSGSNRSCHTYCAVWGTCYRDEGDYDEYTTKSNGTYRVSRKDRKLLTSKYFNGPEKVLGDRPSYHTGDRYDYIWTVKKDVIVPWTTYRSYKNYIASSENIIKGSTNIGEEVKEHPADGILDHLYQNKVFGVNLDPYKLAIINSSLKVPANLIIYGFKNGNLSQCENLKAKWINGKVNDLVLCLIHDDTQINNVEVFGWTESEILKSELETLLLNTKLNSFYDKSTDIIDIVNKHYVEKDMNKYSYLSIKIRGWDYVLFIFFYLVFVIFGWCWSYQNDINDWD